MEAKERREQLLEARRFGRACLLRIQNELQELTTYDLATSEAEISGQRMLDFLEECIENLNLVMEGGLD